MDGCVWIRSRARIWFLVRSPADDAIRRISSAGIAAFVQCGRRAWTDSHARSIYSRVRNPVPVRRRRTHRDDYPFGVGSAHCLALDDRACQCFAPISTAVAGGKHCPARDRDALDDGTCDPGRFNLALTGAAPRPDRPRHCAQTLVSVATPAITPVGLEAVWHC